MSKKIQNHQDLMVYRKAFDAALSIFDLSKSFPKAETYSLMGSDSAFFSFCMLQLSGGLA